MSFQLKCTKFWVKKQATQSWKSILGTGYYALSALHAA